MGFTDAANSVPPARVYQLRVDEVLAGMDPEDRERAVAALRDPANPVR